MALFWNYERIEPEPKPEDIIRGYWFWFELFDAYTWAFVDGMLTVRELHECAILLNAFERLVPKKLV